METEKETEIELRAAHRYIEGRQDANTRRAALRAALTFWPGAPRHVQIAALLVRLEADIEEVYVRFGQHVARIILAARSGDDMLDRLRKDPEAALVRLAAQLAQAAALSPEDHGRRAELEREQHTWVEPLSRGYPTLWRLAEAIQSTLAGRARAQTPRLKRRKTA